MTLVLSLGSATLRAYWPLSRRQPGTCVFSVIPRRRKLHIREPMVASLVPRIHLFAYDGQVVMCVCIVGVEPGRQSQMLPSVSQLTEVVQHASQVELCNRILRLNLDCLPE